MKHLDRPLFATLMARVTPRGTTTDQGNPGWRHVGRDERNRELKIVALEVTGDNDRAVLLVARDLGGGDRRRDDVGHLRAR